MLDEKLKNDDLYVIDLETGTATKLSEIKEITEDMIIGDEDKVIEASQLISDFQSMAVEIDGSSISEILEECEEETRKKPNPIYVPKHIARRRKW